MDDKVRINEQPAEEIDEMRHRIAALEAELSKVTNASRSELTESEMRFRSTFEQAAVGMAHGSPEGAFLRVNQKLCDMLGYTKDELINLSFPEITHPDDVQVDLQNVSKTLRDEIKTYSRDKRYIRKDGTVTWVNLTVSLCRLPSGEPDYFIAVIEDINARKLAEKALIENQRFLSSVFGSIPDGISVLDKDMNIMMVNQTIERWYAHALPLTGKKCFEVYHGATRPCEICPSVQTLKTGQSAVEIIPMTGKGGERIGWNELYSFPLADMTTGAVTGVIEFVRDITDRIHVEEALKESEERYRKLVELSPDGICINVGGRYVFANQSMARNVGLDTPNEVIGKNAVDFVHPASRSTVVERIKQALENGLPAAPVEEKYIRADGTTVFMEVAAVPLVYKGQNAAQVVIRDITERKKTEADLKEQTRTLEKANRELEQFAYISSHHMQEPLRKVINFSGLLERRYKGRLDESADRYLDYLIDGAGRMKALIDDLLVYTRLDHSPPDHIFFKVGFGFFSLVYVTNRRPEPHSGLCKLEDAGSSMKTVTPSGAGSYFLPPEPLAIHFLAPV